MKQVKYFLNRLSERSTIVSLMVIAGAFGAPVAGLDPATISMVIAGLGALIPDGKIHPKLETQ